MTKVNNKWIKTGKFLLLIIAGTLLTLALIVFLINVILPLTLTHGDAVVAFSSWTESWKQYAIISRAFMYGIAWYCWPSLARHLVSRAKTKRINQLNQITDLKHIDTQYLLIERQIIQWRPKLIGIFIIYEAVMLYSMFF